VTISEGKIDAVTYKYVIKCNPADHSILKNKLQWAGSQW